MLGFRLVMGNVVLSLRSGGGDIPTRGLNEVRRKLNGGTLRNTYMHAHTHTHTHTHTGKDFLLLSNSEHDNTNDPPNVAIMFTWSSCFILTCRGRHDDMKYVNMTS